MPSASHLPLKVNCPKGKRGWPGPSIRGRLPRTARGRVDVGIDPYGILSGECGIWLANAVRPYDIIVGFAVI